MQWKVGEQSMALGGVSAAHVAASAGQVMLEGSHPNQADAGALPLT